MTKRSGPFWDAVEGRAPVPRAAATLGLQLIAADPERGTIELAFAGTEDFTNRPGPIGPVSGGPHTRPGRRRESPRNDGASQR
jgi:hypothetical protein